MDGSWIHCTGHNIFPRSKHRNNMSISHSKNSRNSLLIMNSCSITIWNLISKLNYLTLVSQWYSVHLRSRRLLFISVYPTLICSHPSSFSISVTFKLYQWLSHSQKLHLSVRVEYPVNRTYITMCVEIIISTLHSGIPVEHTTSKIVHDNEDKTLISTCVYVSQNIV